MIALNGLPISWENFRQGKSACSKLPKFDRLKDDCIQEECSLLSQGIGINPTKDDIKILTTQANKRGEKTNLKRK